MNKLLLTLRKIKFYSGFNFSANWTNKIVRITQIKQICLIIKWIWVIPCPNKMLFMVFVYLHHKRNLILFILNQSKLYNFNLYKINSNNRKISSHLRLNLRYSKLKSFKSWLIFSKVIRIYLLSLFTISLRIKVKF